MQNTDKVHKDKTTTTEVSLLTSRIMLEQNVVLILFSFFTEYFPEEIKKHSEIGYRILYSVASMRDIAEYVLSHHEKMDGTGYPRGLTDDEITLESKIIADADALDTMLNDRIYPEKFSRSWVKEDLIQYQGTQFSTVVVNAVLSDF